MSGVLPSGVEAVYRRDSRRVLATLIRLLRDFELAEEALHDAFAAAAAQWPRDGIPANPVAWLVSAGRFKAIDRLRRRARSDALLDELARQVEAEKGMPDQELEEIEDDRLRLIFTCCHPALPPDAQVAMTLREVCGLTTEEIAAAFLTRAPTIAQRIVRAKNRIRDERIPYEVPGLTELPGRLASVLQVIYLVFNEGYSGLRRDLSEEAIRMGRIVAGQLPGGEADGLVALMLLHESRRPARLSRDGDIVLIPDQDRTLWNREMIEEGRALATRAMASQNPGKYSLQAAIAAEHASPADAVDTDWSAIAGLYDRLLGLEASPVVELNRAVAIAMREGPEAGLRLVDAILQRGELGEYPFAHSARADFCRRLGKGDEARTSYQRALALTRQEPERRFLERRLADLPN